MTSHLPNPLATPSKNGRSEGTSTELQVLISHFRCHSSSFHRRYGNELDKSRRFLVDDGIGDHLTSIPYSIKVLVGHRDQCRKYIEEIFVSIRKSLSPANVSEEMLSMAGQWPRITTRSLLGRLAFSSEPNAILSKQWEALLISYAQGILLFQRSQRLVGLALRKRYEEFFKELENPGYESQDQYLDWLLIQVGCDFTADASETHFFI